MVLFNLALIVGYFSNSNVLGAFSILSLLIPIFVLVHFLFIGVWLLYKRKWWVLSFGFLLANLFVYGPFLKFGNPSNVKGHTIITFNVRGFNKWQQLSVENIDQEIADFISNNDPEVVCFQEHSRIKYKKFKQYPFRSETPYVKDRSVQVIFSKFPIVGQGSLNPEKTRNNIIYADVKFPEDTIRIYNVHLQSFNIVPSRSSLDIDNQEFLTKRINNGLKLQLEQVELLLSHIKDSPHDVLICGDFNATQFSNVYRKSSKNFKDTFLEEGKGLGATYKLKGLPLRIDFIFTGKRLDILDHQNFTLELSDHYPIMATFALKPNE